MIKLVLTDLDGTLIPDPCEGVSSQTEEAIEQILAQGIAFGPCTGRPLKPLAGLFHGRRDFYATGVLENGTVGFAQGREVFRHLYPAEPLWRLGHFVVDEGLSKLGLFDPDDSTSQRYGQDRLSEFDALDLSGYSKANLHFSSMEELPAAQALLAARFPEFDFVSPMKTLPILDILPQGVSKATGAQELAALMGCAPEEVLVFGDSDNDFELVSAFPHSVAMANGTPKVKAAARYSIGQSADYAVAQALQELAARAREES